MRFAGRFGAAFVLTVWSVAGAVSTNAGEYQARRSRPADRAVAGTGAAMRIGALPSETGTASAPAEASGAGAGTADPSVDLPVSPGVTEAGGYTVDLGDSFFTQLVVGKEGEPQCRSESSGERR